MGKNRWGYCGALVLALAILFSFSTASAEVGVTDTEVRIGGIVDLSGPIAFMGKGVSGGADTYFKMM
jgi:hypothetical protein